MRPVAGRQGGRTADDDGGLANTSCRRAVLPSWNLLLFALSALSCATKGQVRLLQGDVQALRVESARRDSARAAALAAVLTLQQRIMDSLIVTREAVRNLDVRVQADLTDINRQLLQVQELTGQSQQRLTELKAQLDARAEQAAVAGGAGAPSDTTRRTGPTADQLYQNARSNQIRGAMITARAGYQEFLRTYPSDSRAPDAVYYIAQTFGEETPDSAAVYYNQVVSQDPTSERAPAALYQLGRLAEARRDPATARRHYDRVLREYPRSPVADLARERLRELPR
ncbi:MAG: tetratricopeptide repeat protein [Gemmatimonadales bacterium]